MAALFLDTSALAKLYIQEEGTDRMLEMTHPDTENQLIIISLARVELHAAVRRRMHSGDVSEKDTQGILEQFERHLENIFEVLPLNDRVLQAAVALLRRHRLRVYDAIQLAGAVVAKETLASEGFSFVCADVTLLSSAEDERIAIINPSA